jgi:hypothetical protein
MHYWGYVIDQLMDGESRRSTRRSRERQRLARTNQGRRWSRTAPWV